MYIKEIKKSIAFPPFCKEQVMYKSEGALLSFGLIIMLVIGKLNMLKQRYYGNKHNANKGLHIQNTIAKPPLAVDVAGVSAVQPDGIQKA